MRKDLLKQIKSCRRKLDNSIKKSSLNSSETKKISVEMDKLINEYYSSIKTVQYPRASNMIHYYEESYKALKEKTKKMKKFPDVQEWNKYAKENNYLSSTSMQYIAMLNWNYLRIKVKREINLKI